MTAGKPGAISIRQHEIRMLAADAKAENAVPATIIRHVFLGNSRDYMVELADGTQLRVITSAAENLPQGSSVWLSMPPQKCRALAG